MASISIVSSENEKGSMTSKSRLFKRSIIDRKKMNLYELVVCRNNPDRAAIFRPRDSGSSVIKVSKRARECFWRFKAKPHRVSDVIRVKERSSITVSYIYDLPEQLVRDTDANAEAKQCQGLSAFFPNNAERVARLPAQLRSTPATVSLSCRCSHGTSSCRPLEAATDLHPGSTATSRAWLDAAAIGSQRAPRIR